MVVAVSWLLMLVVVVAVGGGVIVGCADCTPPLFATPTLWCWLSVCLGVGGVDVAVAAAGPHMGPQHKNQNGTQKSR